jgi:hypothetical protein
VSAVEVSAGDTDKVAEFCAIRSGGSSGLDMLGLKLNGVVPKEEGDAATAIMRT